MFHSNFYVRWYVSNLFPLIVDIQFSQNHLLKISFAECVFGIFVKYQVAVLRLHMFGSFLLFHWPTVYFYAAILLFYCLYYHGSWNMDWQSHFFSYQRSSMIPNEVLGFFLFYFFEEWDENFEWKCTEHVNSKSKQHWDYILPKSQWIRSTKLVISAGMDGEKEEHLLAVGGIVNWYSHSEN